MAHTVSVVDEPRLMGNHQRGGSGSTIGQLMGWEYGIVSGTRLRPRLRAPEAWPAERDEGATETDIHSGILKHSQAFAARYIELL